MTDAVVAADVLLSDGSVAIIRALGAQDRPGLEALHAKASDESVRMRFFTASRTAGPDYVAHVFSGHPDVVLALVATLHEEIVATATAERSGPSTAEIAFLVSDVARGHGLGTLLLEHLAFAGHQRGILHFTAEVLSENRSMLGVFTGAGFEATRRTESGVVTVEMSTAVSARAQSSADDRESESEAQSLAPLLQPASVAVLGVRRTAPVPVARCSARSATAASPVSCTSCIRSRPR